MKSNVLLIGFMGVGKGSVAREYARKYNEFVIDTDDLIESMENRKIKDIFKEDGEEYFRKLEKKCALWLENNVKNTLISTGGGFYKQENIKKIGKIVLLDNSFMGIYNRLLNHKNAKKKFAKRPLFKDLEAAKRLYDQRVEEYKKVCDFILDVKDKSIDEVVKELHEVILSI